jgi:hypothetical protein
MATVNNKKTQCLKALRFFIKRKIKSFNSGRKAKDSCTSFSSFTARYERKIKSLGYRLW